MPAPTIRADYEQLTQIAEGFAQQAAMARQTLQRLRHQQVTLRGGDWLGECAQAFGGLSRLWIGRRMAG